MICEITLRPFKVSCITQPLTRRAVRGISCVHRCQLACVGAGLLRCPSAMGWIATCHDATGDWVLRPTLNGPMDEGLTYVAMLQHVRAIVRHSTRFGLGAPLMMVRAFSANQIADMVIVQ